MNPATLSLAAITAGQIVMIRRIIYGMVRDLCTDLGLVEGQMVECAANAGRTLRLRNAGGRTVMLDADYARFVEVERVDDA